MKISVGGKGKNREGCQPVWLAALSAILLENLQWANHMLYVRRQSFAVGK